MKEAKDKAEELIDKFGIEKAILCVDDILNASPSLPILADNGSFGSDIKESTKWWQQVKQEILNRQ